MPMMTPMEGPCFMVPMPLNKDFNGPEQNPEAVVLTVYEVWDQVFNNICQCKYEGDAELIARLLNQELGL